MSNFTMTLEPVRKHPASQFEVNNEISTLLDLVCQEIELPPTKLADAKSRYETIGGVLSSINSVLFPYQPRIFPQGSHGLGTANRPLRTHVSDVDLACFCGKVPPWTPNELRERVFQRLEQDGRYKGKVKKLRRCIQLTYADEFHMDIMPCIPRNDTGPGVRLPEKGSVKWDFTHPEGYCDWFLGIGKMLPMRERRILNAKSAEILMNASNSKVEPFPEWDGLRKQPLQRCTQLFKRHRDKHFYDDNSRSPASVILTTLVAKSYERCVRTGTFETPFDLLVATAEGMTDFITVRSVGGRIEYIVANPVLLSENFASKWRDEPEFAENFYAWHRALCSDLQLIASLAGDGLNKLATTLDAQFGSSTGTSAIRKFSELTRRTAHAGSLGIIVAGSTATSAFAAPATTFHGSD